MVEAILASFMSCQARHYILSLNYLARVKIQWQYSKIVYGLHKKGESVFIEESSLVHHSVCGFNLSSNMIIKQGR